MRIPSFLSCHPLDVWCVEATVGSCVLYWRKRSPSAKWNDNLVGAIFVAFPPPPFSPHRRARAQGEGSWEDECIMEKVGSGSQGSDSGGLEKEATCGAVSRSLFSPLPYPPLGVGSAILTRIERRVSAGRGERVYMCVRECTCEMWQRRPRRSVRSAKI